METLMPTTHLSPCYRDQSVAEQIVFADIINYLTKENTDNREAKFLLRGMDQCFVGWIML